MKTTIVAMLAPMLALAAPIAQDGSPGVWASFEVFVGTWEGDEQATFGRGRGERTYRFILGHQYLLSENRSAFEPQEGVPGGDAHEDWTLFSFDAARQTFIARQFNIEGFVNQFSLDDLSTLPGLMRFTLEHSENAPEGLTGSLTIEMVSADEFLERFEIRWPDNQDPMVIRNHWRRVVR